VVRTGLLYLSPRLRLKVRASQRLYFGDSYELKQLRTKLAISTATPQHFITSPTTPSIAVPPDSEPTPTLSHTFHLTTTARYHPPTTVQPYHLSPKCQQRPQPATKVRNLPRHLTPPILCPPPLPPNPPLIWRVRKADQWRGDSICLSLLRVNE